MNDETKKALRAKPTIEELEDILNAGEEPPIKILPNGEVQALSQVEIYERTIDKLRRDIQENSELKDNERNDLLDKLAGGDNS